MPVKDDGRWFWVTEIGPTVRVEEMLRVGGNVHLKIWSADVGSEGGYRTQSLGHPVRDEDGELVKEWVEKAKDRAKTERDALEQGGAVRFETPTLGNVLDLYRERVLDRQVRDRSETQRSVIRRDFEYLENVLGRDREMDQTIGTNEFEDCVVERTTGAVDPRGHPVADPEERQEVSRGTAERPFRTLSMVVDWAQGFRLVERNAFLLDHDPVRGLEFTRGSDPEHIAHYSDAECEALLAVADQVGLGRWEDPDGERISFLPTLLTLAMNTGRRRGALVALRWSDWRPDRDENGMIRWRAEEDKVDKEWWTPVLKPVREALERHRRRMGSPIGDGPIFPAPRSEGHVRGDVVGNWLVEAEKLTREDEDILSVEHVEGRGWHGFRARFATKLKHKPDRDVAHLGGWKLLETLREIYQREDPDSTRETLAALDDKTLAR